MIQKNRQDRRQRIKKHIRKSIRGSVDRPRFVVYRSLKHLYALIVDDLEGKTIVAASTLSKDLRDELKVVKNPQEQAAKLGEALGKKAMSKSITNVVFDRNGYRYHGVVKALAEGARKAGLVF